MSCSAVCAGHGQLLAPTFGDDAAEQAKAVPVSLIVGVAETGDGDAGVEYQREVNHPARIARVQRQGDKGLVGGKDRGINADPECQRYHRHHRETGIAEQHAHSVADVLEHGLR